MNRPLFGIKNHTTNLRMKKLYFSTLGILLSFSLFSQSKNNPWQETTEITFAKKNAERRIVPNEYQTFSLDLAILDDILKDAPMRFSDEAKSKISTLVIPMPDGVFQEFQIVEAPVMHPDLAAKFPEIKTYAGWSEEDPTAYLRFGISPKGFHAMVLSAQYSTVYIDVYAVGDIEHYVCYFKKDYSKEDPFTCWVDEMKETKKHIPAKKTAMSKMAGDCQFRTYELALACTGEYAQFHGGTVPDVVAEFNVAMARVNGIYEREVDVTMVMVPNNDDLIFLNAATDPYTNNSGGTMLGQNQTTCDNIIGNANYDIGHVFSTGGGGVAFLNSVCTNSTKARGVTGLSSPVGDQFYVDFVAHEMGHQFGGNHTQNNSCNRNGPTAMEPGSASTIMGYAGICAPNVQNNSDDYFHAISLDEMGSHISGTNCATETNNGNDAPSVTVPGGFYNVPISTPFVLTADGSDPNGNALSYCWEQMDNQVAAMPPQSTNTGGPAFRTLSPKISPSRYFPNLNTVLNNSTETWEVLPSVGRNMNFRVTVRDNNAGGGCTAEADVILSFSASAGPFEVTEPNTSAVVWSSNFMEMVTWDVANTDGSPVNASTVDILLSVDGGQTYPHILLAGTPNDGSQSVQVPNVETSTARIMVKGGNNVFYDLSDENFTIEMPSVPTFTIAVEPAIQTACPTGEVDYIFDLQSFLGFNEEIQFSATGTPPGATLEFQPNSLTPPGTVTMTIGELENVTPGNYTINVEATTPSITNNIFVDLVVLDSVSNAVVLTSPADGETGVASIGASLSWENIAAATNYLVELAFDPGFQSIEHMATVGTNAYNLPTLLEGQVYYWRVKGSNICNDGPHSPFFAFQTGGLECGQYISDDVPITIPVNGNGTVTSTLEIPDDYPIATLYVYMEIAHSWVGDLLATLSSPSATNALLFNRPGEPASTFGCDTDDLEVGFSDDAPNSATDFEDACNPFPPAISGDYQPLTAFSVFNGESSQGTWTLTIEDLFPTEDGGSINNWYIDLCGTIEYPEAVLLNNNILPVTQGQEKAITDSYLEAEGTPSMTQFILLSLPENGLLYLQGDTLELGDSFTQEDINSGNVSYEHDGSMTTADEFLFDVADDENRWLHYRLFQIEIIESVISASAILTQSIDCHDANNAIITITAVGGTPPLEYSLNGGNPQSSNEFDNLGEGVYEVTVTDSDGLTVTTNAITINNPPAITAAADVVDDDITVTANGGTGTLQYSIDGTNYQGSNVFENLANGVYTITVLDENGCTETTTAVVAVNTLVVNAVVVEEVSCTGEDDGTISANVGGGTPPYTYSLNGGPSQNDPTFDNLPAATYSITVLDDDGFTQTTNDVTLNDPAVLTLTASVNDDDISANGNGGTGTLQYSIDGTNFQSSNVFENLANGTYTITVMDENGCMETTTATVLVNTLVVSASQTQDIDCFGGNDGEITANVSGGSMPFEYSLDGVNFQSSNVFQNLAAGTYFITVKDADGFTQATSIILTQPSQITGSASANGYEINVSANGGTGTLQYSLNGGSFQSDNTFYPVATGTHTITVLDENGCKTDLSAEVDVPVLTVGLEVSQVPLCHDGNEGQITVVAGGGVPPYEYNLNGGSFQSSNIFTGLVAGNYTVTIMDSGGFTINSAPLTIIAPSAIMASATSNNTEVTVNAGGGTSPYLYQLDNGSFQSSNIFIDVANGIHTVTVQDANGCETSTTVSVNVLPLQVIAIIEQQVSCYFGADGIVVINASGGIPPYEYSLDGFSFQASNTFTDLAPGNYQPTLKDAVGQIVIAPVITIINPLPILADGSAFGPVISVDASGGTGTLTYSFDGEPFQSENEYEVVWNGTYNVIVMDENGCSEEIEVVVNKPEIVFFVVTPASCADSEDGQVYIEGVEGGYSPFLFSLNDGPLTSDLLYDSLGIGEYIFLVVDSTGFEWYAHPILIDAPPPIVVDADLVDNNLTINAGGGTGDLQYSIDDGVTFQSGNVFNDLPNGVYEIVVMDENGCTVTMTIEVNFNSVNEVDGGLLFEVSPNPGPGVFNLTIKTPAVNDLQLTVYDLAGKLVYHKEAAGNGTAKEVLDLSFLINGHYQLRVTSGELWGVKRLVIVR